MLFSLTKTLEKLYLIKTNMQLTNNEITLILEIIKSGNFPGTTIDLIHDLKVKLNNLLTKEETK